MEQTVSVIVPVYNCKEYLPRCIESILNQTYPQIQLILLMMYQNSCILRSI